MEADQRIYIHLVCKLDFGVHGRHSLVCNAVASFSHGRLLLLDRCQCRLQSVLGGLAGKFCNGSRMVLCRWVAGGSILVGVD